MNDDDTPTLLAALPDGDESRRLCLMVVGDLTVETVPLPVQGSVSIGRAETNDLRIEDPLISREHAIIVVDGGIWVEDLGSANGTRLSDAALRPGDRAPVKLGQVIEIGSSMLIAQPAERARRVRHLRTHSAFEAKLADLCEAAEDSAQATVFATVRVRVSGDATPEAIAVAVTGTVAPGDVIACYAPGEYELLLPGRDRVAAAAVVSDLAAKLAKVGGEAVAGQAIYPEDARTPHGLIGVASARLTGDVGAELPTDVVVEDEAMRDLYRLATRIAHGTISVLLLGETGVGKEVFASAIHRLSRRADGPCVKINCAALAATLLEAELFGYEEGAFTGAEREKPGLLETAHGGTVFLDEVGEMPPSLQVKLLRVIEDGTVTRVGGIEPRSLDLRYIAATNRDLEEMVLQGSFRQDLYYRLNGVSIVLPPLRERPGEVGALARIFARQMSERLGLSKALVVSPRALALLEGYRWPGNIRELRNVIERAALLATGRRIEPEHLPLEKMTIGWRPAPKRPRPAAAGEDVRAQIVAALEACDGNQTRAAKLLGISRRTLSTRLNKYDIPRPRRRKR